MSFRSDFIADLPTEPAKAIITLADRAQSWLEDDTVRPDDKINGVYIRAIFNRFIERYDLGIRVENTSNEEEPSVSDYVIAVTRFAGNRIVDQLLDEYDAARGGPGFGTAVLTPKEKQELHAHLNNLREIVETSSLATRKKNALFSRINDLATEIDKEGANTDRFFAFLGDTAFVLGEMAEKAAPFTKEVKEILKIVMRARAKTEGVALPKDNDPLGLPSPSEVEDA